MSAAQGVVVVVPAYRETDGLRTLLDSIGRLPVRPRVVVAVDGAWAPTVELARGGGGAGISPRLARKSAKRR